MWNGKVEKSTFVDPTERAIFNTFFPQPEDGNIFSLLNLVFSGDDG
jgi:hypothetical protein